MFTRDLHPYQTPGVEKFLARGSLLAAMGTGTGKTIVAIAAAEELLGRDQIGICLVVCPAGLKYQWAQAISAFTDITSHGARVRDEDIWVPQPPYGITIDGPPAKRARQYAMIGPATDYVILSYDNVLDDSRQIRKIKPGLVVLDEASQIKNPAAQRTRKTKLLLEAPWRLALTATPIENRPEELFSVMQWVDADVLGRWDFFDQTFIRRDRYGDVLGYRHLDVLHKRVSRAMYVKKRTDPDVASYLPAVHEDTWAVEMTSGLREAYTRMARDLLAELRDLPRRGRFDPAASYGHGVDESTPPGRAMAIHQALERLLDHPGLVVASGRRYEESEARRKAGEKRKTWPGSRYCYLHWAGGTLDGLQDSPKLERLRDECSRILRDPTAKILIYTKYADLLPILSEILDWPSVTYHGGMNAAAKEAAKSRFRRDPAVRLFLSSHAGAYGCDMWMANHLVNLDQPPSAGRAEQINGRHVRAAGDFHEVFVHDLVTLDTIEERNTARLAFKKKIGQAVIEGRGAFRGRLENDVEQLTMFLERTLAPDYAGSHKTPGDGDND
jgi:SNF2 family DNA or RNA helicase